LMAGLLTPPPPPPPSPPSFPITTPPPPGDVILVGATPSPRRLRFVLPRALDFRRSPKRMREEDEEVEDLASADTLIGGPDSKRARLLQEVRQYLPPALWEELVQELANE